MIETLTLQNTTYTAMIGAVALLAGAAVGGVAGVISAQLTSKSQRVLERDRSEWAREDAVAKELSAAVQQLTIEMASALHSMLWLTWYAYVSRGDRVTKKRLDDYDSEMHKTIPKILGYLSTVGTINTDVREQLQPLVDEILALDVEVAKGGLFIDRDRGLMVQELADCYEKMVEVERLLPERIGSIVRERSVRYPGAATSGRKIPRS